MRGEACRSQQEPTSPRRPGAIVARGFVFSLGATSNAARPYFQMYSSLLRCQVLAHSGLVFDGLLLRFLFGADEGPRSNIRALAKNEIEIASSSACFITHNPLWFDPRRLSRFSHQTGACATNKVESLERLAEASTLDRENFLFPPLTIVRSARVLES